MRTAVISLLICLFGMMLLPAQALNLTPEQINALPEEAQRSYQAAQVAYGERQQIQGLGHLIRATQAAPESAPLNLVLARVAGIMAEQPDQPRAAQLFGLAQQAATRASESASATEEQKAEAQQLLNQINANARRVEELTTQAASQEAMRAQIQTQMIENQNRAREARESTERATQNAPERNADGTPRYTGSRRYMQGIQDARDIQQGRNQP